MENLFQYHQIACMNKRELSVYNYVSSHLEEASKMNIRELAAICQVSTTTILRFCSKVNCDGYTEFRYRLQQALKDYGIAAHVFSNIPAIQYLQNLNKDENINQKLNQAAKWCTQAKYILFLGEGVSGTMSEYGARLFSSAGMLAFAVTDPCYPPPIKNMADTVILVLSISGENAHIIALINNYKKRKGKIISITNTDQCTVARISELNFSYYMPLIYASPEIREASLTTQIPVVCLLENLARKLIENENTIRQQQKNK